MEPLLLDSGLDFDQLLGPHEAALLGSFCLNSHRIPFGSRLFVPPADVGKRAFTIGKPQGSGPLAAIC